MRLRTFEAGSMHEAMTRVRDELGADAVIVSSEVAAAGVRLTAALEAPRPKPHVVGEELRHAAFAHPVEQQDGAPLDALHQDVAAVGLDVDLAEPAAPARRLALRSGQLGGHRMAPPEIGERGPETALEDLARGARRQHEAERRAEQAVVAGEGGAGGGQQRAALLDIAGDVAEIAERHHAAPAVAVEDDQVELVELDLEQLADRRGVLLLGRAQDGEVDQIDRRVGLEQVAPDPLASMGLARDQQHAQPVADAVHRHHGAVVDAA